MKLNVSSGPEGLSVPITPVLLSRREAARALSLSQRGFDYLIAQNRIKVKRVGGRVLVPYKALLLFAESDHTAPIVQAA